MEASDHDIVIVGAGIAGLTTSLALHRQGVRSLVLESSENLRVTGFALSIWTNAWKALDALGVGDFLRQQHHQIQGNASTSMNTGNQTFAKFLMAKGKHGVHEIRFVLRRILLETLANELPSGTIRFSSKVVNIEESSFHKLVHLADGTILKTKVLIGCDGVNSLVAKWLGFTKAAYSERVSIRGCITFPSSHGMEPRFNLFFGKGVRFGAIPCDHKTVYWFFTWTPTSQEEEVQHLEENPPKMKQLVLSKLVNVPDEFRAVIENTELDNFKIAPLRYRPPWEILWGNISKGNVSFAGDAFHPMTPDIGQGGCAALEDGITLARCIAEAFSETSRGETPEDEKAKYKKIEESLKKYASERQWRSISLISTAYMVGFIQQSDSKILTFLRDKFLASYLAGLLLKRADFDCGKLKISS